MCAEAMGAGAFEGRDALELAEDCVELGVALAYADYRLEPEPPEPGPEPDPIEID
jgi:hypothetical protein